VGDPHPLTLTRLKEEHAPGPWRYWWLCIVLLSLAAWAVVILMGVALLHLLR